MDPQRSVLDTEDVQRTSLSDMPHPIINRILQYVYKSEGSAALQCRLVSQSFNEAMLMNMRVHLNYKATLKPNRCQLSLSTGQTETPIFPTDQLINSRLIERIVSVKVAKVHRRGRWVPQDLVRLASELSRPVDVRLYTRRSLPIWPTAETPQMRVVEVEKKEAKLDLSPSELDFMASLEVQQHLRRLVLPRRNLLQLSQRVDQLRVSELIVDWQHQSSVSSLDLGFSHTFRHLQVLTIRNGLNSYGTGRFSFRNVSLPHLVQCEITTVRYEVEDTYRLLTSMRSAMPQLKRLRYTLLLKDNTDVVNLVSTVFPCCPATVEEFLFDIGMSPWQRGFIHRCTKFEWEIYWRTLFTAALNSNLTRLVFNNGVRPTWYDVEAKPFEYEESSSGAQVGLPETPQPDLHIYKLKKKRNGQICTLDINSRHFYGR